METTVGGGQENQLEKGVPFWDRWISSISRQGAIRLLYSVCCFLLMDEKFYACIDLRLPILHRLPLA